jgi:hypothetical protein
VDCKESWGSYSSTTLISLQTLSVCDNLPCSSAVEESGVRQVGLSVLMHKAKEGSTVNRRDICRGTHD